MLDAVRVLVDDADGYLRHPGHGHPLAGWIFLPILAEASCEHGAWYQVSLSGWCPALHSWPGIAGLTSHSA